jgi:hypothetical protein
MGHTLASLAMLTTVLSWGLNNAFHFIRLAGPVEVAGARHAGL